MFNLSAVIFAGGASRRMGQNKALLPFGGYDTLAQYQYERLKPLFKKVYISTKNPEFFKFTKDFIIDTRTEFAPTIGLLSSIEQLNEEKFFVLSVDSPFVGEFEIKKLLKSDRKSATVARVDFNVHPLCGVYHSSLKNELEKMIDENHHKLQTLLKNKNATYVDFADDLIFSNLNDPDEYKKALTKIRQFKTLFL